MLKRGLGLLLAVSLLFSLSGCTDALMGPLFLLMVIADDDRADKEDIFEFVLENESELLHGIEAGDYTKFEDKGFIGSISEWQGSIEFSCGGAGFGSGTAYVGFFYSPVNDMTAVWCAPPAEELAPCGDGFEWYEEGGDNYYYTEHICGKFYYYEASF